MVTSTLINVTDTFLFSPENREGHTSGVGRQGHSFAGAHGVGKDSHLRASNSAKDLGHSEGMRAFSNVAVHMAPLIAKCCMLHGRRVSSKSLAHCAVP